MPAISKSSNTASGVTTPLWSWNPPLCWLKTECFLPGVGLSVYVRDVDLDRYLATNQPTWERLAQLSNRAAKNTKNLSDAEMDELIHLYQRVSTHLSYARSYYRNASLNARLTTLVSGAGSTIYGTKAQNLRAFWRFFSVSFPAAVWHSRRALLLSFVLLMGPALVAGAWIANSPEAVEATAPPALREAYINEDFEEYYESERASQFSSEVFTNNVRVAILAFGGGILLAIPTVSLLMFNGANIGFAGGLFAFEGQLDKFLGLIAPHGLLELTAIIVAGAAGIRLGWSIVSPGAKTRKQSLSDEARRAVVILLGLVPVFLVAGLIEGFVTGQPWPTWVRVGFGAFVEAAFVLYIVVQGRLAQRQGKTGAVGEDRHEGWARSIA